MKFLNLKIKNFGSVGDMVLPLDRQGLVLLLGRNEDAPLADSNGAGKSLPLDAFTWALWGSTVRGISGDEVVNRKARANCVVSLEFEENDQQYKVIRYRKNTEDEGHKPNDLILEHNGTEVSGASMAATQEVINAILGLDFATFCAMMPGAGVTIASMTDYEVKSLLEKLLRTEVLSKAAENARKRFSVVKTDLALAQANAENLGIRLEEAQERLGDLNAKAATFAADKLKEIEDYKVSEQFYTDKIAKINKNLAKRPDILGKHAGHQHTLSKIAIEINTNIAQEQKTTEEYRAAVNVVDVQLAGDEVRLEALRSQAEELDSLEADCPICHQEVSSEQRQALIEENTKAITAVQTKIDIHNGKKSSLKAEWVSETEKLDQTLQLLRNEQDLAREVFHLSQKKVDEIKTYEIELDKAKASLDLIVNHKRELLAKPSPYNDLCCKAEAEMVNLKNKKDIAEVEVLELDKQYRMVSFWVDSFSPQGLRSFMLENITPILNNYAKKYADIITEGEMTITFDTKTVLKSGDSKEKFNIKVSQKHGGSTYASNSSGERARANLIIALALGELAVQRSDKVIPFRFLDEPFESIDETGSEAIVNLLNQMKDQYNTVYVITHQDYLKQLFPKKLTIVKENGYSKLET